jgi:hypothetical protein
VPDLVRAFCAFAITGRELYSNSDRAAEEAEFEKFTEGFKADYERVSAQLEWLKEHRADEVRPRVLQQFS